jgi:hypothetical protein
MKSLYEVGMDDLPNVGQRVKEKLIAKLKANYAMKDGSKID